MRAQVKKDHYRFSRYMSKRRWTSVWHQIDEVLSLNPSSILEIGPGPGLFKALVTQLGVRVETLDVAEDLNPDYVGSATDMPFEEQKFDVVCAFQMLEHLPFELSLKAMGEMARVAKTGIVISLPDAQVRWPYSFHIPRYGTKTINIKKPLAKIERHIFDGEHYWELNKQGYEVKSFKTMLSKKLTDFTLTRSFRVPENPYHHFFVLKRDVEWQQDELKSAKGEAGKL